MIDNVSTVHCSSWRSGVFCVFKKFAPDGSVITYIYITRYIASQKRYSGLYVSHTIRFTALIDGSLKL
jgi:hypothetical protein